jgi:hypothetical protein
MCRMTVSPCSLPSALQNQTPSTRYSFLRHEDSKLSTQRLSNYLSKRMDCVHINYVHGLADLLGFAKQQNPYLGQSTNKVAEAFVSQDMLLQLHACNRANIFHLLPVLLPATTPASSIYSTP